ncbi:MAG: carboxymuconolactone decarboxylase family protein [Sulfitobacter sp.]
MSSDTPHKDTYAAGKALSEKLNPGMEDALRARYDALVPGMSRTIVDVAYGQFYARGTVDEKTRLLATVAALTALGGQTKPQLKVNIASARAVGASREEVCEIIFQMALYGGLPSMINGLNAALEVFETEEAQTATSDPVEAKHESAETADPKPAQPRLPKFMTAPLMGEPR